MEMPLANAAKRAGSRSSLPITVLPPSVGDAQRGKIAPRDVAGLRCGAGEREADAVEHRTLAEVGHVGGDVLSARGDDEAGDVIGEGRVVGSGGCGG